MAFISREGDEYIIRTTVTREELVDTGIESYCYTKRAKIKDSTLSGNTLITMDVGVAFDPLLAYLFRAICDLEKQNEENR